MFCQVRQVTKILGKTAIEATENVIKSGSKTWFKELSKAMAMGFLEEGAEGIVGELGSAYLAYYR